MKTEKRSQHRIVIPVLAAAGVAFAGGLIYQLADGDSDSKAESTNQVLAEPNRSENYLDTAEPKPFSEQVVNAEVQSLQRSLSSLQTAKSVDAVADDDGGPDLQELQQNAQDEISALKNANEDNWDEMRLSAHEALEEYAAAIGQDTNTQPSS